MGLATAIKLTPGIFIVYLLVTIAIGLWAAKRVHNSKDYLVAGRQLGGGERGLAEHEVGAALADHHLYALIVVAVSCGLREGELRTLPLPS